MVVAVDFVVFSYPGTWEWFGPRVRSFALERGLVRDWQSFRHVRKASPQQRRVFVVGSSRVNASFRLEMVEREVKQRIAFGKVAHAAVQAYEIRSLVDDFVEYESDVVVIGLSEFDINGPLRVVPPASFGSFSAVRDLISETGVEFSFGHRLVLLRLGMVGLLESYQYRYVVHRAVIDKLRRFELDKRLGQPRSQRGGNPHWALMPSGVRRPLADGERQQLLALAREQLPELAQGRLRSGFNQIHRLTRGPHAGIQAGLIRRAIHRLVESGIRVLIVELPLHPIAPQIYDSTLRDDFFDLAQALARDAMVDFLPLESTGPFEAEDFADLTHLKAAPTMTQAIATAVDELLEREISAP